MVGIVILDLEAYDLRDLLRSLYAGLLCNAVNDDLLIVVPRASGIGRTLWLRREWTTHGWVWAVTRSEFGKPAQKSVDVGPLYQLAEDLDWVRTPKPTPEPPAGKLWDKPRTAPT